MIATRGWAPTCGGAVGALLRKRDARQEITREDVCAAFEVAKNVPLAATVRAPSKEERRLIGLIAGMEQASTGVSMSEAYDAAKAEAGIGYSTFYKSVKKFDEMRLVDINFLHGRGRTVERVVNDFDEVVKIIRFDGWQETNAGTREVKIHLRQTLKKYDLHRNSELFDRAYAYTEQYY